MRPCREHGVHVDIPVLCGCRGGCWQWGGMAPTPSRVRVSGSEITGAHHLKCGIAHKSSQQASGLVSSPHQANAHKQHTVNVPLLQACPAEGC